MKFLVFLITAAFPFMLFISSFFLSERKIVKMKELPQNQEEKQALKTEANDNDAENLNELEINNNPDNEINIIQQKKDDSNPQSGSKCLRLWNFFKTSFI